MNAETSSTADQVRSIAVKQLRSGTELMATKNCNGKRKKLSLTLELTMMQLKRTILWRNNNHKNNPLVDDRGSRIAAAPARLTAVCERTERQERVARLTRYADGLRRLDRAKGEHADDLERFLADVDRVIGTLRTAVEDAHETYETRKRQFFESYLGTEFGQLMVSGVVRRFAAFCDQQPLSLSDDEAVGAIVDELRVELRALATDVQPRRSDGGGGGVFLSPARDTGRRPGGRTAATERADEEFPGLCRAIESMRANNRTLEAAADRLEHEMAGLRADLCDVTAEYTALDANKLDKKCVAVALDDFCAVTEQITAEQVRNLEFGRTLAVDDRQIAEQLNDIERLKAKLSKKRNKRRTLVEETETVMSELDAYKIKYEELERKKACLVDDLMNVKRSPGESDQFESQQGFGQRVKHLKQLKIHYNKLANKRDALKSKLQKQQMQVAKTPPSRTNT